MTTTVAAPSETASERASSLAESMGAQSRLGRLGETTFAVVLLQAFVALDVAFVTFGGGRPPSTFFLSCAAGVIVIEFALVIAVLTTRDGHIPETISMVVPTLGLVLIGGMLTNPDSHAELVGLMQGFWLGLRHHFKGVAATLVGLLGVDAVLIGKLGWSVDTLSVIVGAGAPVFTVAVATAIVVISFSSTRDSIRQAEQQQASLVSAIDLGVLVMDRAGRFVSSNPAHQRFSEIASPRIGQVLAGEDGAVYGDAFGTPLPADQLPTVRATRGEEFENQLIWIGRPGSQLTLSVSARTMRGKKGDFRGSVLAYQDVTEVVRALRVKEDFVASVSHELRTPLTSILGYVEYVVETEDLDPEVARHLDRVLHNANRLNRLVEDLLHTTTELPNLHPVRTNLAELLPNVLESVSARAKRAGIHLHSEAVDSWIEADPSRVEQVMENLVTNAVKYGRRDGNVTISIEHTDRHAVIRVSDDGIGMSEEDQRQIFDRFYRAMHIRKDAIAGVGLGLAICRDIVRAHGGTIGVESALGKGSIFTVELPLADVGSSAVANHWPGDSFDPTGGLL